LICLADPFIFVTGSLAVLGCGPEGDVRNPSNNDPSSPAAWEPGSRGEVGLLDYWYVVLRRRSVVLACWLVVLAVTATVTFMTTPIYVASTTLQIERRGPDVLNYKSVETLDPSYAGYEDFYQTQYKIMQSRAVLGMAAERLDLAHRPEFVGRKQPPIARLLGWMTSLIGTRSDATASGATTDPLGPAIAFLARGLSVRPVRNSHLVKIAFADRDPALARDVANALASAYHRFNLESRYSTTAQASEFLTKQVAQLQLEIAEKERLLQEHSANKEILALRDETQDISSQSLAELNRDYVGARARLAVTEARYESVRDVEPQSLAEVLQSPLINSLKQQYAEIERERSQMTERFRDDWPALRQLNEELAQAEQRIELETRNIAAQVRGVAQADYRQATAEVESLRRRVEEQKREVQRVSLDAVEIASLRSEIDSKRQFLDELTNRQNQTAVSDRMRDPRTSNIRVVDEAELPISPVKPRKLFNLLLGTMLGLLVGVGAAFLVEHLDDSVINEEQVERLLGFPVMGQVPKFGASRATARAEDPPKDSPTELGLVSHAHPQSVFAEAFKNLRTSLLLASPQQPPRNILVTSCEPSDGKSTVAANLAIVLTQAGRRVLLIDADLRRPHVHRVFGVENGPGLSSVLTGNAKLDEVIGHSCVPLLDVITAGPIPPIPSELLGSSELESLLEQLRSGAEYDHVVLDSPPAVQVADSVILSATVDTTVLVVRAGKTRRESLSLGGARFRQSGAHVSGVVLNSVQERAGYYQARYEYAPREPVSLDRSVPEPTPLKWRWRKERRRAGSA
jgi:capsular exopolysaccharide synthesis family protein